jgi:formylmethanofuran dehydrogenase subunit C
MHLELSKPVDCLCDFTYDFYWQHEGKRLDPKGVIPNQEDTSYTYEDIVTCLKNGEYVHIKGNAGKRLGSSLGVDLKFFGGNGAAINTGSIIIDGDVDTRMGISMVSGAIYVSGNIKQPIGNVVEVESDRKGYHKFRSITGILQNGLVEKVLFPNVLDGDSLYMKDGIIRDTIAARLACGAKVIVEGDAGMSTGILMKQGLIHVEGRAGQNTGVLLSGGTVVAKNTDEFAGTGMRSGILIISGKSKGYVGAGMKGGTILYKGDAMGKPAPVNGDDIKMLGINRVEGMMFKKYTNL